MTKKVGFGVMTAKGSILATNGEYYKPAFLGPGTGHSAKVWKTEVGAQRVASRIKGKIFRMD